MIYKFSTTLIIVILIFTSLIFGQSYSGPAAGSVSSGVVVTTDNFLDFPIGKEPQLPIEYREPMEFDLGPVIYDGDQPVFDNYVYVEDSNIKRSGVVETGTNFELYSFSSIPMTNSIPPDPHMAVGPDHVIAMVNGRFHIYDRQGNLLKNISDAAWVVQVINHPTVTDPQVIYDHYENRWVMLWLTINDGSQQSSMTVCCSDDDDPLGTWYMYALNGSVNGTTNSNAFGDYPQLGYDDIGIYISSREFYFAGGFAGAKIKILDKSELYSANGAGLTWTDLWNIRLLNGQSTDDLHPCITYDAGTNIAYFIIVPNYGSQYYLYKITNPISNPILSGVSYNVTGFGPAPDANQLGGGTPIHSGGTGSGMRNSPIIRDGLLYAAHHIRNSQHTSYASIKYFVINLNTNQVVEQVELGADGYFYLYPAIAVDQDHNLAITFSRSADTEYIGSYYSTKLSTDPPGLSPSKTMMEGQGNYDVTFGGEFNRWGDYLSAALDPANQYNIWLFSEYAAATNKWGTWLTEIRMKPFTGVSLFTRENPVLFNEVEVGTSPTQETVTISNYGEDDLVINSISTTAGPFTLLTNLSYPVTLSTYDSLDLEIEFAPSTPAIYSELMSFDDNDPDFDGLVLNGTGYTINEAYTGVLYSSTGAVESGKILTVDVTSGTGTELGISNYEELNSLTISPVSNVMYGISTNTNTTELVRVNAMGGDAFTEYTLDIGNMSAIAFNSAGVLYASELGGDIYTIDLSTGDYTYVTSVNGISSVLAMTIDQMTDEVWVAPNVVIGTKDKVYTLDLTTGDVTLVGQTGFGKVTNDMAIDETGTLYGIVGGPGEEGELIQIDRTDGTGTLVGNIGYQNIVGLAYSINGDPNSVDETGTGIPESYSLSQNYPNPFNPETSIEFTLPVSSKVTVTVYNLLGQVIRTLANSEYEAGGHSILWNGRDERGKGVSSGIYFYELKANGTDGIEYSDIKKMILMK